MKDVDEPVITLAHYRQVTNWMQACRKRYVKNKGVGNGAGRGADSSIGSPLSRW